MTRAHRPTRRRALAALAAALLALPLLAAPQARAASESADVIDLRVRHSIERLYQTVPGSRELMERAKGVLVVPGITKAGFIVGGAYGEGALMINGNTVGYYSMASASFGFQAGAQKFDQALFFMTTAALEKFRRAQGWEVGADAEVTVPDQGLSAGITTTTAQAPVIAVTFGQTGLMGGVSLEGAKYTPITP
ncbi:MAG: YSC84-related protein [Pseudomonadota bacterium]